MSGYDPYLSVDSAWNLSSKVEHVTDLNVLFRTCDYLTMHIHSTPETFHYLNAETFAKMKPGMRILNFARGELVDDDALLAAIESGQVGALCDRLPERKARRKEKCRVLPASRRHDAGGGGKVRDHGRARDRGLSPQRQHPKQRQSPERDARPARKEPSVPHPPQPARMLNRFLEIIAAGNVNVEHMLNKARGEIAYTIFDTTERLDETAAEEMRAIPGVTRVRLLG